MPDYSGSFSGSFQGTIIGPLLGSGVVSQSNQISFNSITNKPVTISDFQKNSITSNSNLRQVTFPAFSSSVSTKLTGIDTQIGTLSNQIQAAVSGTVPPGTISSSDQITINVSGSTPLGFQFDKLFNRLQFDSSTGLNVSESAEGTAFISIGSHFSDIIVDGQLTLFATGSQSLEIIAGNGIKIFTFPALTGNNTSSIQELEFRLDTASQHFISAVNNVAAGIFTLTGSFFSTTNDIQITGSLSIGSGSFKSFEVNSDGFIVLGEMDKDLNNAPEGTISYSGSNFYLIF